MGKKLIITEKPSVARDFARVLKVSGNQKGYIENNEYVISWCYGHLVEMVYPEQYDIKYKSWKLEDLPFLPKDYKYGVIESAKDQYVIVNSLLHREDIDTVYWAGDSGKEGQTIEENIRNYGGVREGMDEKRVWIDSQTDEEIIKGINTAKPMSDYALLGKSGIMRTIEDYSLGINFSRALSVKYGRMINDAAATKSYTAIAIGRVMTCVLGMVVNREREIRNFTETPFYKVLGTFSDVQFNAEFKSVEGSIYYESYKLYKENGFKKEEDAQELISSLEGKTAVINNIETGVAKKKAPLLFNLAELQSECSKIFKISPSQTLDIIQDLYEKKFTTYPRTDARVLTTAIAKEIYKNINGLKEYPPFADFCKYILENKKYSGIEKTAYTDDSKVTDHYAIIPTGHTNGLDRLDSLHKSVYELICKRFLAIFYPPAEYKNIKINILIDTEQFFSSAKVLKSPGYMTVSGIPSSKDKDDSEEDMSNVSKEELIALADKLQKGDTIDVKGFSVKEGKTSPPKRYTSGNLILAMENAGNLIEDEELRQQIKKTGIGTSATRGEILEKLVRIKYLNQNSKTQVITPEKLGEMIYEVVLLSAPSLLNPEMTASWEKGLEGIINGTVNDEDYRQKLEDYIRRETNKMINSNLTQDIANNIHQFTSEESRGAATRKNLGIKCPACGGELTTTSFGYGCANYRNDEIKCKFGVGKICGISITEEQFIKLINEGITDVIQGFTGKSKNKFSARLKLQKDETGQFSTVFDFNDVPMERIEDMFCPACGGQMVRTGYGYACENHTSENSSCYFSIGTICGKKISESDVRELLSQKRTKTIRGFKSAGKKSFDACLIIKDNENGQKTVSFDFENVEAKEVKDVVCPLCGGKIVVTSFGYGCSNYKRKSDESEDLGCRFMIGKIAGVKIKETQLKELLNNGITSVISGFKSSKGTKFDAKLRLEKDEDGKYKEIKFEFDNTEVEMPDIKCPKCSNSIIKVHNGYRCKNNIRDNENSCDFFVGKIAGVEITNEQFTKLIKEKKTDVISGFLSKKGMFFDARLSLDEKGDIKFDFDQFS